MKKSTRNHTLLDSRQKAEAAERALRKHRVTATANLSALTRGTLRITPLGGQNGVGEKNMIVVEYEDDALVLDCGFDLGIDLPGVNYAIPATTYLQAIRHKLRGYVISHGHLDHIGALVPMREVVNLPDSKVVVVCTGGQGEPGAAMSRMAAGEHKFIKLKKGDSVVISSTPIPGNEQSYQEVGNQLALLGVAQFRHPTHEIDGVGPLHVSGHGNRDEHAEMIRLTRPRYFMPIYGGALHRQYHQQVAVQQGIAPRNIVMASNGEVVELSATAAPRVVGNVPSGALLVDRTGAVVPEIVVKDRLLVQGGGFLTGIVTIDARSRRLVSSPDIITRGCLAISDNPEVMEHLRRAMRACVQGRKLNSKTQIALLRNDLKDAMARVLYDSLAQTPVIIPVVTIVSRGTTNVVAKPVAETC